MRFIWVDTGDNPYYEKLQANGIDGVFFDPRDPRVTREYMLDIKSKGYKFGIYAGAGWGELGTTPTDYVAVVNNWVKALQQGVKDNAFPRVQFDLEMHDPAFILEVFRLWRAVRPWQATSWTLEGFQGGLFSPDFVRATVNDYHIRVCPQYFTGSMKPWAQDRAFMDLVQRGFPPSLISGCYDAAILPEWWDGYAFTQGRLP